MSCAPARSWTWSSARTPGPAPPGPRTPRAATPLPGAGPGPGTGPAGRRGGRVRRAGHADRPAGHRGRPGGPARRAGRAGPGRPLAGPRPGRRRRAEPGDDLVRDGDRRARPRRRARLRPARTQKPRGNAPGPARRRAGFCLHPGQPGRPARRIRHLAAARPGRRAGPDRRDRHPGHPDCQHRYQARGHDPGVRLRHLSQVRHATCTSPVCRRPAPACDFEHNTPYEAGGRTCLCNGGPKCRHDHRLKQQPGWKVDQLPDGTFRWTTPAGRSYDTEPTRYPI